MARRDDVYHAIDRERRHQQQTHGGADLTVPGWLLVIEEELREAKAAWVRSEAGDDRAALGELLQVAACCVAALEQHGVHEREEFTDNEGGR